ncbi:Bug family tripartite tricarboxylate transporter substrate binding protein [Ottowia thiooxydans]|uniref:Bug family tripartite tricarboxylate transporter substrate binding protein n=1 Tax=Ottowia thiooxydans TaxID=219182 RepID=UPI000422432F|nr:tripartite tricarboxylate transporter substrate binding protein [Ottowia thiooxydans]
MQRLFSRRRLVQGAIASSLSLVAGLPARAQTQSQAPVQTWPVAPIRLVVPYPPGGPNDIAARLLAEHLTRALGQPVLVDNRAGAGGVIGSAQVTKAAPNGQVLLFANSGALVVQSVLKTPPPYDPATAFTPIVKMLDAPNFIAVGADVPANSIGELIELARKNPGKLNYSSPGTGSFGNFVGEYLKLLSGVDMVHIPGKGSAWGVTELMAGRIQVLIDPIVLAHQSGGRLKVLATTAEKRSNSNPDVPTVKESGGPDMVLSGWFGLLGPADLPPQIVSKLEAATRSMLSAPDVVKTLAGLGLAPEPESATRFSQTIRRDLRTYRDIKVRANIHVD